MGINGVTDFDQAKAAANGIVELIRLADGVKGEKALPEEFAHFALEALGTSPLVDRLINNIASNNLARTIIGEDYDEYDSLYNNNQAMLAKEAAGKLLAEHLLKAQDIPASPYRTLLQRVISLIKNFFQKLNASDFQKAIVSADKDLQIACTPSYCMTDYIETRLPQGNRFGQIYETMTAGGKFKVKGKGTSFFWWQMLAGDKADNVQGIQKYLGKLCGDVGAYNALAAIRCEHEAANLVLSGYMDIDQNPLPEAAALWLLRTPNDTAEGYIASLNLNNDVRSFINDCYQREWKREASTEVSESAASCDSEAD